MTSRYLLRDIESEEGRRQTVYLDSLGKPTIGVGHYDPDLLPGTTWTDAYIDVVLRQDVHAVTKALDAQLPWWRKLDDNRQDVLVQMGFQLGVSGLLKFKRTLAAVERGQYGRVLPSDPLGAADYMLESTWAKQTPARATRMSGQMRSGQRAWAHADGKG